MSSLNKPIQTDEKGAGYVERASAAHPAQMRVHIAERQARRAQ